MNRLIICEGRDDFVFTREFLLNHFNLTESKRDPFWRFDRLHFAAAKLIHEKEEVIVATPRDGGKENLLNVIPNLLRYALNDGPCRMGVVVDPDDQSDDDLAKAVESRLKKIHPSWRRDGLFFEADPVSQDFRVLAIPVSDGASTIVLKRNPRCLEQVLVKAVLESRPDLHEPVKGFLKALEAVGVESSPKVARTALMAAIDPATISGFIASVVGGTRTKRVLADALEARSVAGSFRRIVEE